MPVEQLLRRVVGVGLGEAVGVLFTGDGLPVGEVEGDLDEGSAVTIQVLTSLFPKRAALMHKCERLLSVSAVVLCG